MPKIAIIQFPGSNCEYETKKAAEAEGLQADIIRWNSDKQTVLNYQGYILPGGFSYQDRVRAGAISSKLPIIEYLEEADKMGKPILGICNGCQILAEAGFIPGHNGHKVEVALGANQGNGKANGFRCDWVFVKWKINQKNAFTRYFSESDVLPIPVNHGEGRFVLSEDNILNNNTLLLYCDSKGHPSAAFPVTPNGSSYGIAGMMNTKGNVLAMMPHPERGTYLKQLPFWVDTPFNSVRQSGQYEINEKGPWAKLFLSMKDYINQL